MSDDIEIQISDDLSSLIEDGPDDSGAFRLKGEPVSFQLSYEHPAIDIEITFRSKVDWLEFVRRMENGIPCNLERDGDDIVFVP
ncbi:MAG: hypothetical protein ACPG7F_00790 [Aggregatilineales bacterium]